MSLGLNIAGAISVVAGIALLTTFERPPVETVQRGYRGLGMAEVYNPRLTAAAVPANALPEITPKAEPSGTPASAVYQNVQVLGDVDSDEFLRLMTDITNWVSPAQGCAYCHAEGEELSSDKLYTKVVSRRMIQMVRHINADWKSHVGATGVTCYTCHRGQPVPQQVWSIDPGPRHTLGLLGNPAEQNRPALPVGFTSLPYDPFTAFLDYAGEIRVASRTALPEDNRRSIKQTEWTYGLMMHFAKALGVNCTYCHNSRSFFDWDQSTPQRTLAWYGIRMVRDLNRMFLEPLKANFPPHRLGSLGDVLKVNCGTCHQGVFKPLYGARHAAEYPELLVNPPATPAAAPAAAAPMAPAVATPPAAAPAAPAAPPAVAPAAPPAAAPAPTPAPQQ